MGHPATRWPCWPMWAKTAQGAVQLVTPERLPHVLSGAADGIERLSSADVAARLSQWPHPHHPHPQTAAHRLHRVRRERDVLQSDAGWVRVHQEDFCQALGVMPQIKYQNEGGPGAAYLAGVLWVHASQPRRDVELHFNARVFNYLIGETDAHAKNDSLLLGSGAEIRLAPL